MLTFALYVPGSLGISLLQDSIGSDSSDLGRKLLGGFAVALRLRDKNPPPAFISVTSCKEEDSPSKLAGD